MGTLFRIDVADPPPDAERLIREALEEVARLETVLSEWQEQSDISRINREAGKRPVQVADDTFRVIDAGIDVSRWSRGRFDLSWAALWGLYDFRPQSTRIPTESEIAERLPLIEWRNIRISPRRKSVFLKKPKMAIGTGGIAKGYAIDQAGTILRGGGVQNYMISGGGQVQVHGQREGRPWRIGIRHPRDPSTYFAALESTAASFSTSGDYERAFIDGDGNRWHHIIDTKTGRPATESISATVMTSEGIYADALSTAAFVMGPKAAMRMFGKLALPAQAVIVGADCRLWMTEKAAEQIRFNVPIVDGRLPNCEPE